jgi:hypothetical protein
MSLAPKNICVIHPNRGHSLAERARSGCSPPFPFQSAPFGPNQKVFNFAQTPFFDDRRMSAQAARGTMLGTG